VSEGDIKVRFDSMVHGRQSMAARLEHALYALLALQSIYSKLT